MSGAGFCTGFRFTFKLLKGVVMPFLSIAFSNFRNLQNARMDLHSREVFFVGENGQGKSNILESLYISAYGSSFRTKVDSELIKNGEQGFSLSSFYKDEYGEKSHLLSITYEKNKKRIEKNRKVINDRKELINTVPCVLFNHDDLDFVIGEPERRRFFLDQSISMFDLMFLDVSRRYRRTLKNKNIILKGTDYSLLDSYDSYLVQYGTEILKKRTEAIYNFNLIFSDLYEKVSGIDGVHLVYEPSWKGQDGMCTGEQALKILYSKRESDKMLGLSTSGPHRDLIKCVRNDKNFIPVASMGQRRLIAIVLRIAQAVYYKTETQRRPVLLMDDVLLEIDHAKREKILALLPDYEQLFCTFLPGEPYKMYTKSSTKIYKIENGVWNE